MEAMRRTDQDQTAVGGAPERSGGTPPTEGPAAADVAIVTGLEKQPLAELACDPARQVGGNLVQI